MDTPRHRDDEMKETAGLILSCFLALVLSCSPALAHDTHRQDLIDRIKAHEGWRSHPYRDSEGNLTVGFGTNLDAGLVPAQGECLVVVSLDDDEAALRARWRPYLTLSAPVRGAILEMVYQMGVRKVLGFGDMLTALSKGDYTTAADEALDSKWARQDSPARARELAAIIRAG